MNQSKQNFCQSCGMPMNDNPSLYGTNKDGSPNKEYCIYCFKDGQFTFNGSMEEMIEICIPGMTQANQDMSEEKARQIMLEWFPTLKRWKKA